MSSHGFTEWKWNHDHCKGIKWSRCDDKLLIPVLIQHGNRVLLDVLILSLLVQEVPFLLHVVVCPVHHRDQEVQEEHPCKDDVSHREAWITPSVVVIISVRVVTVECKEQCFHWQLKWPMCFRFYMSKDHCKQDRCHGNVTHKDKHKGEQVLYHSIQCKNQLWNGLQHYKVTKEPQPSHSHNNDHAVVNQLLIKVIHELFRLTLVNVVEQCNIECWNHQIHQSPPV